MAVTKGSVSLSMGTMMGIKALRKDLLQLSMDFAKNGGLKQPLERCRDQVIIPSIRMNFAAQGRPTMWEPIGEMNFYRTQRGAAGAPILQPTGGMKNTALKKARFHISNNVTTYGNWPTSSGHKASRYGYVHDMGGKSDFGEIPARPFALYQNSDIDKITKVFAKWSQERAARRLKVHYGGF